MYVLNAIPLPGYPSTILPSHIRPLPHPFCLYEGTPSPIIYEDTSSPTPRETSVLNHKKATCMRDHDQQVAQ